MTKQRPDVLFGADSGQVRESIAAAVAGAVAEAAGSIRSIRDYLDELDASVRRCRDRHDDQECSVCVVRGAIVEDIRRMLPTKT